MLPFTEKVNILYLKRKEKIYAEDAQIFGNSESPIHETVKTENRNLCLFDTAEQVAAAVVGKCLVRMEKALNLYREIF